MVLQQHTPAVLNLMSKMNGKETHTTHMCTPLRHLDLLSIPQSGGKMPKRLGGIIGCKDKTSSWHLNGFPDGVPSGQQYNTGNKPAPLCYTLTLLTAMQGHKTKTKTKNIVVIGYNNDNHRTLYNNSKRAGRPVAQRYLVTL